MRNRSLRGFFSIGAGFSGLPDQYFLGPASARRGSKGGTAHAASHSAMALATRKALLVCGILSSLLYGAMIWTIASEGYVGGLLIAYGSLGLLWPFAPMHSREALAAGGGTLGDTMHVVLAGATVLLMFVAMGFAAGAFGNASASTPSQASLFSSRLAR
jgi:hypothetical protein